MKVSVLLFCALISFASFSQNATLSGKITDNETKEALIGATVIVEKTTLGGITDLDGKFTIKNIAAGSYQIRIKYIGYEDVVESVSLEAGQNKNLG
jgi:iron complex outermembrane receptor protein